MYFSVRVCESTLVHEVFAHPSGLFLLEYLTGFDYAAKHLVFSLRFAFVNAKSDRLQNTLTHIHCNNVLGHGRRAKHLNA